MSGGRRFALGALHGPSCEGARALRVLLRRGLPVGCACGGTMGNGSATVRPVERAGRSIEYSRAFETWRRTRDSGGLDTGWTQFSRV